MRRIVLIAAVLLMSASAQAGVSRSLSLASNDEPVAAEQPKAAEPLKTQLPKAEVPQAVEQQGDAAPQPPKADQPKPDQPSRTKSASRRSERIKFGRSPLEARVVGELHRHGIYW